MTETAQGHAELVERLMQIIDERLCIIWSPRKNREAFAALIAAALSTPSAAHGAGAVTEAMVDYVLRYGGRCRDCADEFGICPSSGLPCDVGKAKQAIHHTLEAIAYGTKHGYLDAALPSAAG